MKMIASNAFLSNTIESGLHHWSFRINQDDYDSYTYIGIWNDAKDPKECFNVWPQSIIIDGDKPAYYGLNLTYGELMGGGKEDKHAARFQNLYCDPCAIGDIVYMNVDLNKNELSYGINDKPFRKAFDVEPGVYRAVVSFEVASDLDDQEIELLFYC